MRRLLMVLILPVVLGSVLFAQSPATNGAIPTSSTGTQATAVCNDGQRFLLPAFETNGLTAQEIARVNLNNALSRCNIGHSGVLKILAAEAKLAAGVAPQGMPTSVLTPVGPTATATPAVEAAATTKEPAKIAPPCAENGSCAGDISATTGKPKTVHVNGYTRKDGTYVRGHYRSKAK